MFVSNGLLGDPLGDSVPVTVSPDVGCSAPLPQNLWEKDGIQNCPDTYFLTSGLIARNVTASFHIILLPNRK